MKPYRHSFVYSAVLVLWLLAPAAASAQKDTRPIPGVHAEEWDTDPEEEAELKNAQATLDSLFGHGKTMAIPPRIAGGTVALPSFDSNNLEINEEVVAEDSSLSEARNAQRAT